MSGAATQLEAGREAARGGQWSVAYDVLSQADVDELSAHDLVTFADAAWWSGRADEALELRERAHSALLSAGDRSGAVRMAITLAWDHMGRGAMAVHSGWMARAERLLAEQKDSEDYAYFVVTRAFVNMELGENEAALSDTETAEALGTSLGNAEVLAIARVTRGRILVHSGRVEEGLALLDEASAAAASGELRPFEAGMVYCVTISSCHEVGDLRRALEWTDAANRWCDRNDVKGFPGACRVHRAQVLRLRGLWSDAEVECEAACAELQDYNLFITAEGQYEIGEIRRRRGDFAAALEAYRVAGEVGFEPQPGLALLRLAEGKVETALAALRRSLEGATGQLAQVQLLPALVEVALAAGDVSMARRALQQLGEIVMTYRIGGMPTPAFEAQHQLAMGRLRLAEEDLSAAAHSLRQARTLWQQVGAPYEVAQAGLLLGLVYRKQGDEEGAMVELEAAHTSFERLGARLDKERATELLGRLENRRTFVFTDIVGSTRLAESLGDDRWRRLLARHDHLLRGLILEAGGEVIKQTGDGFFAAFSRPEAAIQAAIAIQRALLAEVVAPDVRIGVHTAGAFHPAGNDADYAGQGVHMAARIGAAAEAGEILVSSESLDGALEGAPLSDPRDLTLKGFSEPVQIRSVRWQ